MTDFLGWGARGKKTPERGEGRSLPIKELTGEEAWRCLPKVGKWVAAFRLGISMLFKEKLGNKWFSEFTCSLGEAKHNPKHHTAVQPKK